MLFSVEGDRKTYESLRLIRFLLQRMRVVGSMLYQVRDELTKNRRENNEAEEGGFMYERQGVQSSLFKSI